MEVPEGDLRELVSDLEAFLERLTDVTRLRVDAARLRARAMALLPPEDDDKTPVRPPSSDAVRAFKSSSEFLAVKPPRRR